METKSYKPPDNEVISTALLIGCTNYDDYESAKPAIDLRRVKNYLRPIGFDF